MTAHDEYRAVGSVEDRVREECAELIKVLCKVGRFGWNNHHPDHPERQNWQDVLQEIDDVLRTCKELKKYIEENVA